MIITDYIPWTLYVYTDASKNDVGIVPCTDENLSKHLKLGNLDIRYRGQNKYIARANGIIVLNDGSFKRLLPDSINILNINKVIEDTNKIYKLRLPLIDS